MRALCWHGADDLRVERVPDPTILAPQDAIIKVTLSSVCGSDLPLLDGLVPTMRAGDVTGQEALGEVVEKGPEVLRLNRGDRVVVSAAIGCGKCWHCRRQEYALCDNSNPEPSHGENVYGHAPAGMLGCGHVFGGYAGSHAEYLRIPYADVNAARVPDGVLDEQAVLLSGAAPAGWMAAEMAGIRPGDVVAVWGCGAVGQMAMRGARSMGAHKVIGIDRWPDRLKAAQMRSGAEPLDFTRVDVFDALLAMTGGRGPDVCIDAVGMAADGGGSGLEGWVGRARQAVGLERDRAAVLRAMIRACRKGGTLSIVGDYGGVVDGFPIGAAMNKALTLRMGRPNGRHCVERLLDPIEKGELDPSDLLTHQWPLDDAPRGYQMFKRRLDGCMRVVFTP